MNDRCIASTAPSLETACHPFACRIVALLLASTLLISSPAAAAEGSAKTRSIEVAYSLERLSPQHLYGTWHTGNIAFYNRSLNDVTWFIKGSVFDRLEGKATAGTFGAYRDWAPFLYTYSSITAGTRSPYLPRLRVDHDMNFKFGTQKRFILICGITFVDYFSEHTDVVISGGPLIYWRYLIFQYRLFHNESNPGAVQSNSHLISVAHGQEGWQWTHLSFSVGKRAYLATAVAIPQEINQNAFDATIYHRRWLGKNLGVYGNAGYLKIEDGYEKYGISIGGFHEF